MFSDLCCLAVSWILGEIWFCGIGRGFIDFLEPCLRIYFCNQRNLFLFNKRSGHRSFQHLEFSSSTKTKLCGTKFRLMQGKHQHWVVEVVKQSTEPSNQRTGTQPEQHWEWNTLTRRKTVGWWYDIEITLSRWQICWTETMMHNVECWGFNLFFFDRFMVQCHARSLQALYHSGRSGDMDLRSCLLCLWGWRPKLVRNSRPRLSPPAVAEGCGFGWINLWISVDLASGCNLYFDIFDLLLEFSRGCFWVQARWFVPFNDFPMHSEFKDLDAPISFDICDSDLYKHENMHQAWAVGCSWQAFRLQRAMAWCWTQGVAVFWFKFDRSESKWVTGLRIGRFLFSVWRFWLVWRWTMTSFCLSESSSSDWRRKTCKTAGDGFYDACVDKP